MKLGAKICILVCFFVVLAGLIGVSVIRTEEPEIANTKATQLKETTTEKPTRPPEQPTEKVTSAFTKKQLEDVDTIITKS